MKTIQTLTILTILILTTPLILSNITHITPEKNTTINEINKDIQNTYTSTSTQTIHVYNNQSIQEAINNSNPGDTIYIHNGTYHEHIIINKTLKIIGENKYTTIIDGDNEWDAIILISNSNIYLNNITVTNQSKNSWTSGIYVIESFWTSGKRKEIYNITIYNCIVENCSCGIRCTNTTNVKIINSTIHNNSGTGIYVIDSTNTIVDNCTIYKNGQGDRGVGIGIWKSPDGLQTRGSTIIKNCRIYENLWNGIAVSKSGGNKGELTNNTIYNNIIDNNRINEPYDKHGTGIDIRRTTNIIIKNNIITNHPISQNIGGGIYLSDCKKTTIEENNIESFE